MVDLAVTYSGRSYYGSPDYECSFCGAVFWFQERCKNESSVAQGRIVYNGCCKGGKVALPIFRDRPEVLSSLVRYDGDMRCREFIRKIRQYNSLFAFTSMGADIDRDVNDGGGPLVFKINGLVYHRVGSLLPRHGRPPQFAQLYIYDTANEVSNRINAITSDGATGDSLDQDIVADLMRMLDEYNPLVKQFRMARDLLARHGDQRVAVRIVGATKDDPVQFDVQVADELAALVVGDFSLENYQRDVIVDSLVSGLQHVSCLHPAFMSLQYPLLFPYGERGFQLGIPYRGCGVEGLGIHGNVTMQDYFCYYCHYRCGSANPYTCYGRLSAQCQVDAFACIEECRLTYIADHQADFRSENFQGIADAVGKGCVDGSSVGKQRIIPASFVGGKRYMNQNFQDAVAICRVYGAPDFFVTFTCNPKWPEISEALFFEMGQRATDRSDIIVRVYHMKLAEFLGDIREGVVFGPVVAGACFFS